MVFFTRMKVYIFLKKERVDSLYKQNILEIISGFLLE